MFSKLNVKCVGLQLISVIYELCAGLDLTRRWGGQADRDADVLVLIVTPDCAWCRKVEPTWKQLAKKVVGTIQ